MTDGGAKPQCAFVFTEHFTFQYSTVLLENVLTFQIIFLQEANTFLKIVY